MSGYSRSLFALVVVGALASVAITATAADKKKASVKVVNKSDWTIVELYLSPVNDTKWGPDQLGEETIKPGDTYTLTDVPCDNWDVRLVDEDKDVCIVEDVDICAASETWTITSKDLLKCQEASKEEDEE
jgi:hypothetical protein